MIELPCRVGLHIVDYDFPGVTDDRLFDTLTEVATLAEASGYDSIWPVDHMHSSAHLGGADEPMLESSTIAAMLAARTTKMHIGVLVAGIIYRNPALLAKITTTLDVLSGGRAALGVGASWSEPEHAAYGYSFPPLKERFERLEDTLQIARAMFTESPASFEGKHHRITDAYNVPRPVRGDIPIIVGGNGRKQTLRLAAKYADGANISAGYDEVRELLAVLEGHCEAVGRDPAEITKTRAATLLVARTHEEAEAKAAPLREYVGEFGPPTLLIGDPDTVGEEILRFRELGIDGFVAAYMPKYMDLESLALTGSTIAAALGSPRTV